MNELDILEQRAIDAAINLAWEDAIILNKKILKIDKNNLGAQLRLGFVYLQKQELDEAKKHYRAVLKIQSNNPLAQENLEKIKILSGSKARRKPSKDLHFNPNLFLEVPGKTKSVVLVNVGQKNILAALTTAEEVYLKAKKRKIETRTQDSEYVGTLPDDLSKRLFLFIKGGSQYRAFIKEVSLSRVVIFIREEKRGKRVARFSSFPKNSQAHMGKIVAAGAGGANNPGDDDKLDDDEHHLIESDLEQLADTLAHEEKEYLPYQPEEEDEENIEE